MTRWRLAGQSMPWARTVDQPSARSVRFHTTGDIPAECYPFAIEWFSIASGASRHRIEVAAPGVLDVPGAATWGEPVRVVLTFADGTREEYPTPRVDA